MNIAFRQARETDLPTLLGFMRSLYEQDGLPFRESSLRDVVKRLLRQPALGRAWIMEEDGEAIGYVVLTLGYSLEYRGRDAFVDELYVREDRRRRGIGTRALAEIERACRELDVKALHLVVDRSNRAAQALYRSLGYTAPDRLLMTRTLDPGLADA